MKFTFELNYGMHDIICRYISNVGNCGLEGH